MIIVKEIIMILISIAITTLMFLINGGKPEKDEIPYFIISSCIIFMLLNCIEIFVLGSL
jgi:uncharacterized membrane protein